MNNAGKNFNDVVSAGSYMITEGDGTSAIEPAAIGLLSLTVLIKLRID